MAGRSPLAGAIPAVPALTASAGGVDLDGGRARRPFGHRAYRPEPAEAEGGALDVRRSSGVDPTHNAAERALRGPVIRRKLSFGTPSTRGNRFSERLSTAVATCRQQGRAVLAYLREAIEAFLFGRSAPPLVPVPDS